MTWREQAAARRSLLHVAGSVGAPADGMVEGVAIKLRGGPVDGNTGEHLGAYPQRLEINLGTFGVWTYLKTGEWIDVVDFRPGTLEQRTRRGRIYEWNGRDPDGHPI